MDANMVCSLNWTVGSSAIQRVKGVINAAPPPPEVAQQEPGAFWLRLPLSIDRPVRIPDSPLKSFSHETVADVCLWNWT